MPTKEELESIIDDLRVELALAQASEPLVNTPKPEKVTKMYWPNAVDTSIGSVSKAFGLPLQQDENGNWFAEVPESRVKAELSRKCLVDGATFTLENPATEEEE